MMGKSLRDRAGRVPPRAGSRLGHAATIAFAAVALAACEADPGGGMIVSKAGTATLMKVCDESRAIYWTPAHSRRGHAAIAIVENAPDCNGSIYVLPEARGGKHG
jgi:hypothetical protein